ncbi:hypothetical protein N7509_004594 [Penicillium cosmopolitanum]|uniref:LysM domain-containing protein n=1 Tax=Penicillium cosmopolitanum TaxID=1131564 RepID=A0A9X0B979_9EURO|nr:uncharacterized protein N7509_004594 [Penicillium cosmopolitanum]KAJ5396481.1 hypothetical protein N7509_004594 [Penicillium cosmopolitanum]
MGFHRNPLLTLAYLLGLLLDPVAATVTAGSFQGNNYTTLHARDISPYQPDAITGICYTYVVQAHDSGNCKRIAETTCITVDDIEKYNKNIWLWRGCKKIMQGDFICLGPGAIPMPVALPNAKCGPQVVGTGRPANMGDLASLNPCPSKDECCQGTTGGCTSTSLKQCKDSYYCIQNCVDNPKSTTSTTTKKKRATTSTTTTTTATTTTKKGPQTRTTTSKPREKTWSVTIYQGRDCEADDGNYALVEGYTTGWSECIDINSDFKSDMGSGKTSCRLFIDGGYNWTSCDHWDLLKPGSWYVQQGLCDVYTDGNCGSGSGRISSDILGCQDKNTLAFGPEKFGSLMCKNAASRVLYSWCRSV